MAGRPHPTSRPLSARTALARSGLAAALALLAGCATPLPRQDDPYEKFNRKMFAVNDKIDSAVLRPAAVGYRKITTEGMRHAISNFFANVRLPISVGNYVLQARPAPALETAARFIVNTTVGLLGFFDPASKMGLKERSTDFGVTLAKWRVPEGPYLFLPVIGPTDPRDAVGTSFDARFLDPIAAFQRHHDYDGFEYFPFGLFIVSVREGQLDQEGFIADVYDPYVFVRDAYRQMRLAKIYEGNPPPEVIRAQQGINDADADKLLQEQEQYEQRRENPSPPPAGNPPPQPQRPPEDRPRKQP